VEEIESEGVLSMPIPAGLHVGDGNEWFYSQGNSLVS